MMGKPNLKAVTAEEAPPSRTVEREALAAAVAQHDAAVARLAAIKVAQQTARAEYYAASAAADTATAAIEEAKGDVARHLTDVAMGTAGPAPKSVQHYRAKAQEAEDARDAAQSAQEALAEQHKEAENAVIIARVGLDSRIKAVLAAEAPVEQLIVGFHKLRREFVAHQQLVEWLDSKHAIPADRFWQRDRGESVDGTAPWEAALAALETDPDAPLPS
jgi:hypothetical protein